MQEIVRRHIQTFDLATDTAAIKEKMLHWCNRFSIFSFLDSCNYPDQFGKYDCLAAVDVNHFFDGPFSNFQAFEQDLQDWLFGHFSFDLFSEEKSEGFPAIFFFQPRIVLYIKDHALTIESLVKPTAEIFDSILATEIEVEGAAAQMDNPIQAEMSQQEYISIIEKIKQHIQRGDCYELNFCTRFFIQDAKVNPITLYKKLTAVSPNPFSCFYKKDNMFLLCASPERFLQKAGNQIISQPIKGTISRDLVHKQHDELNKNFLQNSQKEKAEHVMAVDLARNDLSRCCEAGSVHVPELYGIYPFPQVYQMISTVKGTLMPDISFSEILKATFPMASMTGAPKKKVLELIETYEKNKRGIFSGSVGYISPQKNVDFNVVIRSMIYNNQTNFLFFPVGGGITILSEPEAEYAECLLKAMAIRKILS